MHGSNRKAAAKFWCGDDHGHLTVAQIAKACDMTTGSVRNRLDRGWSGEQLMLPKLNPRQRRRYEDGSYRLESSVSPSNGAISIAVRLARKFPGRPPTIQELQAMYPMSRATAYRWRAAFIDAGATP